MLANVSKTVNAEDKNFSKKAVIAKKNRHKDKFPCKIGMKFFVITFMIMCHSIDYLKYIMNSGKSQENGGNYYNASYVNVSIYA